MNYSQLSALLATFLLGGCITLLAFVAMNRLTGVRLSIRRTMAVINSPSVLGNRLEEWDFPPAPHWTNRRTVLIGFGYVMEVVGENGPILAENAG